MKSKKVTSLRAKKTASNITVKSTDNDVPSLKRQNIKLRAERDEARETLRAISSGEVDAFLVQTTDGEKVFTLNSAEHAYRVMVEAMNEGAATMLMDGTIIYCNNKFAELLEQSANYVCGEKIWPYIAKRDFGQFSSLFAQAKIKPAKGELFLCDKSGSLVDVHVSLGAVDFNGTRAVSMVITDLTERKQNEALTVSENLTRSILEQAAEAIIVCDADGFITRANPEAQRLIGINPVLLPFDKAFHLKMENGELFPLSEMKRAGRITKGLSVSIQRPGYSAVELSMSISHLENLSVGVWHVVTLTDVTPLKRMEKLKAAKEAAESANSLKTSFLANMSHEIRTPLGAIVGFADLMKETEVSPALRMQYLEIISRSGKALTVLIDDILDLSKIEAGGMAVEHIDLSPTELMDDVVALFSQKVETKKISLVVIYENDVPVVIKSDPSRLRQVLVNIIGNAIKFTSMGQVEVRVSSHSNSKGNGLLQFRIRDTGVGLNEEQQKRIFSPFTQGDESTTRKFGGTGLGLVLSRRLARALGGDVVLESSEAGVGSIFCVSVARDDGKLALAPTAVSYAPIKIETSLAANCATAPLASAAAKKMIHSAQSESKKPAPALKGLNILVVDDSLDNQILFSSLFTGRGASVTLANDGRQGVDKALQGNFDVVIMDIQMPVLDGYGATKELRRLGYARPIIALTAYAMNEEKDRCKNMGCNAHLAKPINIPLAVETIIDVIAKDRNAQSSGLNSISSITA